MTRPNATLSGDFADLLDEFVAHGVEFIIVGAHALARHGYVRTTLDLDVLVRPTPENARAVVQALAAFGAPLVAHGVSAADFATPGTVYQLGVAPTRIDILTAVSGVGFDEAWRSRIIVDCEGRQLAFLGRAALLTNKRSSGRPKDLSDVAELERLERDRGSS